MNFHEFSPLNALYVIILWFIVYDYTRSIKLSHNFIFLSMSHFLSRAYAILALNFFVSQYAAGALKLYIHSSVV